MPHQIAIGPNLRKSAYFEATLRVGGKSFSVYNHMLIPGHFGDPEAEYDRLLNGVVMWDVAAQRQVELAGPDAGRLAQYLTPRDLSKARIGQGRYVPLCDHDGWLINDPVLLKLSEDRYWLSVADSDIHLWAAAIGREWGWNVQIREPDASPLAIQGPRAGDVAESLFGSWVRDLTYFGFAETRLDDIPLVLARSGWSKQGGYELYLTDSSKRDALWDRLAQAGEPFGIGPGAPNDSERLESGLISYGADMRWQTHKATPFEMGLGAMVNLGAGHDFVGRAALQRLADALPARVRIGVFLDGQPPLPGHSVDMLKDGATIGHVSEFAYSPRLRRMIGVRLVQASLAQDGLAVHIALGQDKVGAQLTPLPFSMP